MLLKILNVLSIILLIYGLYYIILSVFAFLNYRKNKIPKTDAKNIFKVLVPCRNEEKVIGELIESLKNLKYPKNLYEICVVVNNCTDNTKDIALSKGVRIIEVKDIANCKADAMRYAFNLLKDEEFDAYAVFDADNIVHPDFLNRMNDAINIGYEVAQGNRDSKNASDSWISGSYAIFYYMQNLFFNRARTNIKASASINGTGYIVKKEIIRDYGFDTKTLTEDIEYTAQMAINNVKIGYVEDAITYDEQPIDFKTSWKQRKRWSIGEVKCLKIYSFKLIRSIFKNNSLASMDMLMNFMAPFVQVLATIIMLAILIIKIINIETFSLIKLIEVSGLNIGIITYLVNVCLNVYLVKYYKRKIAGVYKGILLYSLFILTWLPINAISIFTKDAKWEEIKHTRSMKLEDI